MPEVSEEKRNWLKAALGFDIGKIGGADAGEASEGRRARRGKDGVEDSSEDSSDESKAPETTPEPPSNGSSTDTPPVEAKGPGNGAEPGGGPQTTAPGGGPGSDPDVDSLINQVSQEAEALKKLGFDVTQMKADIADLTKSATKAKAITDDPARQKALEGIKKRAEEALEHAQTLSKSVKSIMADSKGNPSDDQKSAAYKKAIEDLYGLNIKVPDGFKNTHFDKIFDMCGTVPKDHVKQDDLKKLTYSAAKADKGSGAYAASSAEIEMGDFGKAKGSEDYEIDGKKIPANSFNVTTLHEIGHAVDEKNGIMSKNQGKDGCGGWQPHKIGDIADAFVTELKKTVKVSKKVTDPMLRQVVLAALRDGTTTQLDAIENDDWQKLIGFLTDKCLAVREDADPWFASSQVVVGGRVYQEAYGGEWYSYTYAARGKTKVNDYQWRSPAEWFAEVYAISWLAKKPPPAGVDAAVLPFMWKE
jgi:hypothetical protein